MCIRVIVACILSWPSPIFYAVVSSSFHDINIIFIYLFNTRHLRHDPPLLLLLLPPPSQLNQQYKIKLNQNGMISRRRSTGVCSERHSIKRPFPPEIWNTNSDIYNVGQFLLLPNQLNGIKRPFPSAMADIKFHISPALYSGMNFIESNANPAGNIPKTCFKCRCQPSRCR